MTLSLRLDRRRARAKMLLATGLMTRGSFVLLVQ